MTDALWDLAAWDALSSPERLEVARRVTPAGLQLAGLARHTQGGQSHELAFFEGAAGRFALVPGGRAALGQDPAGVRPGRELMADYRASQSEYGLPDLPEFLAQALRPARQGTLAPFLIETSATELGVRPVSAERTTAGGVLSFSEGGMTRQDERGTCEVEPVAPAVVETELARGPFRLPTADEWEYACRAGTRTLFRWGEGSPADGYPVDRIDFAEHQRRNAFGLDISRNPYEWELGAGAQTLGGDGGGAICGGAGFFLGWLPLASAYQGKVLDPEERTYGLHLRRVMDVEVFRQGLAG